jgi:hypothetical protein
MSGCGVLGQLPEAMSKALPHLQDLFLARNRIDMRVPVGFAELEELRYALRRSSCWVSHRVMRIFFPPPPPLSLSLPSLSLYIYKYHARVCLGLNCVLFVSQAPGPVQQRAVVDSAVDAEVAAAAVRFPSARDSACM